MKKKKTSELWKKLERAVDQQERSAVMSKIMAETMKEIGQEKKSAQFRKKLRAIDRRHGKKSSPVVQGGLPSLGKNQ